MSELKVSNEVVAADAVKIIDQYFGTSAGEMYKTYYAGKKAQLVFDSLQELLIDGLGELRAVEVLGDFYAKHMMKASV